MKKLKSIFAICALAVMIASCQKEDNSSPSDSNPKNPCNTVCLNGGIVNANCGCDCPPGFTGSNCQTPITQPPANVNVSINSGISYTLPPFKYAGDNEFGGHIEIDGSVQLTLGANNTKIYAVVNATYIESAGGKDTKAKIDGQINTNRILLYTAPAGKKVYSIISNSKTNFYWYPTTNYHGTGNLYPNNFIYRIEMIGDTSGDDLPSDGSTNRSRFKIWFNDFTISLGKI